MSQPDTVLFLHGPLMRTPRLLLEGLSAFAATRGWRVQRASPPRGAGTAYLRRLAEFWHPVGFVADYGGASRGMPLPDGSTCLSYDGKQVEGKSPEDMFREIDDNSNGYAMPGWETERMGEIKELFEKYKDVTADDLWANLKYFLDAIMPVCEECDVKMAIHPDDPPWGIFGLPRIITGKEAIEKLFALVPSKYNGITLCTGSLGASPNNDMVEIIHTAKDRIYFAHLRNVQHNEQWFNETAHESAAGSLDMYEIVKALQEEGFEGYIRPDHGRMIWGEVARPGYGLYDRALGVCYLNGLWEATSKQFS